MKTFPHLKKRQSFPITGDYEHSLMYIVDRAYALMADYEAQKKSIYKRHESFSEYFIRTWIKKYEDTSMGRKYQTYARSRCCDGLIEHRMDARDIDHYEHTGANIFHCATCGKECDPHIWEFCEKGNISFDDGRMNQLVDNYRKA